MPSTLPSALTPRPAGQYAPVVYIVDDDELVRVALASLLHSVAFDVCSFASTEAFLATSKNDGPACLVLDVRLRGESGLVFQQSLVERGQPHMPIIFMSAHGDIAMTVKAMKAGAVDFLPKPFRDQDMIDAVFAALERDTKRLEAERAVHDVRMCWELLTPREREVVHHVAAGLMNKQIAAQMGIAEITTKIHRGQAMRKMNSRSVAELVLKMEALGVVKNLR